MGKRGKRKSKSSKKEQQCKEEGEGENKRVAEEATKEHDDKEAMREERKRKEQEKEELAVDDKEEEGAEEQQHEATEKDDAEDEGEAEDEAEAEDKDEDNDDVIDKGKDDNGDDEEEEEGEEGEEGEKSDPEENNRKQTEANDGDAAFFSSDTFEELPLSSKTQRGLRKMKFTKLTKIQSMSIPALLKGKDIIGAAKTGSGKTLAFLIPAIELLYNTRFTARQGTGIIIITPTRELAMQIYGVLHELMTHSGHSQTHGLIMGGTNRRTEAERLVKGVNIVVCTPGRLLDHLMNTKHFCYRNLLALVIDEADRILEQGFEDDLRSILKLLPGSKGNTHNKNKTNEDDTSNSNIRRQTMLFSATQTKQVEDLIRLSINPKTAVTVDVPNETKLATVTGLEQGYVTCTSEKRFLLLFTFLKKMTKTTKGKKKKIMVFFSSCNSVKFHSELLNYIDIPVMDIHGKQKQMKRTTTFFQFCKNDSGILLCTDVAARGLDIPKVDWIIQYDPPDDPKEYIHRVGRTARGSKGVGNALLFLTPEEIGFLKYLKNAKVKLNEYEFSTSKIVNVQNQLQRLIEKNYYLNRTARDAYRSYILAYASHSLRDIFNVYNLDFQAVGTSFGFQTPPRVDLPSISHKGDKKQERNKRRSNMDHNTQSKKQKIMAQQKSGHSFSASNPYGKRQKNDKRQFSY